MSMLKSLKICAYIMTTVLFIICFASESFAEGNAVTKVDLPVKGDGDLKIAVNSAKVSGDDYLFLPSGVNKTDSEIAHAADSGVQVMYSSKIPSLHFYSDNPSEKGRPYVHSIKGNKASGEVYLCGSDFSLLYHGNVDELKGRGNSTWAHTDKKPYQIKLSKKADLLDPVNGKQKAKKWILLANAYDPTLIRNTLVYYFAREFGITNTPECIPVDLYYDGDYRGNYLLCEKVEIGKGRVEIDDLEEETEAVNDGIDFDELKEVTSEVSSGETIHYVEGIRNPDSIKGGYLLEMDHVYGNMEKSWFKYGNEEYIVSKSPEYASKEMMEYICSLYMDMYNYITESGRKFLNGDKLGDYIDIDSFVRYCIVGELFDIQDAWTSSTYLYKPKNEELLYAGPIWDCDSSMRLGFDDNLAEGWLQGGNSWKLMQLPAFRKEFQRIYSSEIKDIIDDELLGGAEGKTYVQKLREQIGDSMKMNYKIWDINDCSGSLYPKNTVSANYKEVDEWIQNRASWIDSAIMNKNFTDNKVKLQKAPAFNVKTYKKKAAVIISIAKGKYTVSNIIKTKTMTTKEYQVAYKKKAAKKWRIKKISGKSKCRISKLKHKSVYLIKIRALKKTQGRTYYSPWSRVKKVRIN